MKKLFAFVAFAFLATSCATTHYATVIDTKVPPRIEATTVVTDLVIENQPYTYVYMPADADGKLPENQLVANAVYMALKAHGNADVLVDVNHCISVKKGLFGKRVRSIEVKGYPAKYKQFRQPSEEDYKNITTLRPFSTVEKNDTKRKLGGIFGK